VNRNDEGLLVAEAVRRVYLDAELPWPPSSFGPTPLDQLIGTYGIVHEEVNGLNHASASAVLARWNIHWTDLPSPDVSLAGFIYANASSALIFVRRGDGLARRRFTAAHELGHHRLHLAAALEESDAELVQTDQNIAESGDEEFVAMERQANRFAAELLMPEVVCRNLLEQYSKTYGKIARFLVYRLAAELLVSREAIAWRLFTLGLIEKPNWLATGDPPEIAEGA
jgi:hypothetical protein